jgi:hypothetical protein
MKRVDGFTGSGRLKTDVRREMLSITETKR